MIRVILLVLAVARATRFFTQDHLGDWAVDVHARRWANRHDNPLPPSAQITGPLSVAEATWASQPVMPELGWRSKLVSGLDCPFCVGFHLGWLALLGELTIARLPVLGAIWRFGIAAFALNYVVGHLSHRLDG